MKCDIADVRQLYPSSDADAPSIETYTITHTEKCLSSKHYEMKRVYRATMRIESTGDSIVVICKVALGRTYFADLDVEAQVYDAHLRTLQGTVVPRVYGFFTGQSFDGKTGILVLEDCGVPLRTHYAYYPLGFKKSLVDGLVALHRTARVIHNNFDESHVVVRQLSDREYRATLLSFGEALVNHLCPFAGEIIPDAVEPEPDEVPCSELWEVVRLSEIYTRATVSYRGREVPAEWAKDPNTLLEKAGRPDGFSVEDAEALAQSVHAEHVRWLANRANRELSFTL